VTGAQVGFAGPIGIKKIRMVADNEIKTMRNFVVGANRDDTHIINANLADFELDDYAEIRLAQAGEVCPRCSQGRLVSYSGIEVGNLFMLGTKYSEALGATFIDSDSSEKPFIMGSYGIGITRTAQAAVEAFHDAKGIIWPKSIAPYEFQIILLDINNAQQKEVAFDIYDELQERGYGVLLDDRDERPGVKFNDADLIGVPVRISVGDRGLKEGKVEIVLRKGLVMEKVPVAEAVERAIKALDQL
jgi:prolyl-tRNA synthetase